MHLLAANAVVGRHHRLHARLDRGRVASPMDVTDVLVGGWVVPLVLAAQRAAVADKMLGRCDHLPGPEELGGASAALEALDHRPRVGTDDFGILGKALVGAAPAVVPDNRESRRKVPVGAGNRHFARGDFADAPDEVRIASGPEPDVLRENRRADDVGMTVDGIDAEDQRDSLAAPVRGLGRLPERVDHFEPVTGWSIILAGRRGIAARQDRTELVPAHVVRSDAGDVRLDGLGDFLLERHAGENRVDPRLDRRVQRDAAADRGPRVRVAGHLLRRRGR